MSLKRLVVRRNNLYIVTASQPFRLAKGQFPVANEVVGRPLHVVKLDI